MKSAFGVEHELSKAAWRNWYPLPPGVKKIPGRKLLVDSATTTTKDRFGTIKRTKLTARMRPTAQPIGELESRTVTQSKESERSQRAMHSITPPRPSQPNGQPYVGHVKTHEPFRRRGVAESLMRQAGKLEGKPLLHSRARTDLGEKFAQGTAAKKGETPIKSVVGYRKTNPKIRGGRVQHK